MTLILLLTRSKSGNMLLVRIRVPIKLLEVQADIEDYKLQFKGEIDPGSEEFWNREVNRVGKRCTLHLNVAKKKI